MHPQPLLDYVTIIHVVKALGNKDILCAASGLFSIPKSIHKDIEADEVRKDPPMIACITLQLQSLLNSDNNSVQQSFPSDSPSSKRNIILQRKMERHYAVSPDSIAHNEMNSNRAVCNGHGVRRIV